MKIFSIICCIIIMMAFAVVVSGVFLAGFFTLSFEEVLIKSMIIAGGVAGFVGFVFAMVVLIKLIIDTFKEMQND